MKAQWIIIGLIICIALIAGCTAKPLSNDEKTNNEQLVGNDRDEHGCIPSAGYTWCEEKQKCLRTWEESCSDKDDDSTQIANPASQYCVEQGGESKIITAEDGSQSGVCVFADGSQCDEWAYFRGECPKCPVEQVICVEGSEVITYTGDNGCKHTTCKARTYCKPDQRGENIACTMEYMPVCGWFNQSIQCVKYPCAATYGNKCTACADSKVAYWTEGECPE